MNNSKIGLATLAFASVLVCSSVTHAQGTQIKPYIMILLDTSSSMLYTPCNTGDGCFWETLGDGSDSATRSGWGNCCAGRDQGTGTPPSAWDTNSDPDDSRLWIAKQAIASVVSAYGDVTFGLMRYYAQECSSPYGCYGDDVYEMVFPAYMDNINSGLGDVFNSGGSFGSPPYVDEDLELDLMNYQGFAERVDCSFPGYRDCRCVPLTADGGDVLVGFYDDNVNDILEWVDGVESYNGTFGPGGSASSITNHEIRATGFTPLARSITAARDYMVPIRNADSLRGCRDHILVIITDGEDTCNGVPTDAVQNLYSNGVQSYTIGFAFASGTLDDMADLGDDGSLNSSATAFNASNLDDLALAFQSIIEDTVLVEICDGDDDDCDTIIDEGFTKYCDIHDVLGEGATTELIRCDDPGETQCDGLDDNCNGDVDEGLLNDCGTCGALTEICNGIDDDCDGDIDEGGVCGVCVPTGEICDNLDNDCDDDIDEGLSRTCGTNVGECSSGTQTCTAGVWGTCVGEVGPQPEACDGLDNDCDGLVDGFTEACGTDVGECEFGYRLCIDSAWSECMGGVTSTGEVCDNLDNDCDGDVDNGNPGGGAECGTDVGECDPGVITCIGGSLVCDGGTLPTAEVCNGLDDDCDGTLDNGNPEGGALCGPVALDGVGICEAGVTTCVTAGPGSATLECIGAVYPETEDCNGLDDDCNDSVDDGITGGAECGTDVGECVAGTEQCVSGSWICAGEVGPADEECNGLDDDCDGESDEGNPGGGLICGTDVGVCEPGVTLCDTTLDPPAIVCFGEVGPTDEVCNALDDDCNGIVDDGIPLGEECGISDGECEPGYYRCTEDGELECVGGVGPSDEVCDGLDNDCDTIADNEAECPVEGYICWEGYCVGPCDPDDEWPCSTGRVCEYLEEYDEFYCVGDPCEGVTCDDPCTERCYGGVCQDKCEAVTCPDGQTCVVDEETCTPVCVRADCYAPGFGCEEGQRCVLGECQDDPCYEVTCGTDQFCREGECVDACIAELDCAEGEMCEDGECVTDPCHEVECTGGLVCDPATGTCVGDPCEGVLCPPPQVCNPETGTCYDEPCYYIECPEGFTCVEDQCVEDGLIPRPDETPETGPDADTDALGPGQDIIATGAGGCAGCDVTGHSGQSSSFAAMMALAVLGLSLLIRRRAG